MNKFPVRRVAFTLIELLVVIAIMAILATMIIVVANSLGIGSKKARTQTIIAAVRKGIELTIANKGGSVSPVEHPLAGSRSTATFPRPAFKRALGTSVSTSGDALAGVSLSQLETSQTQLMLPDDVYNDPNVYFLFGAKRAVISILGAQQKRVTKYRLLPRPGPGFAVVQSPVGVVRTPYNDTNYPDTLIPSNTQDDDPAFGGPKDNKSALDYVFGSSNVEAELSNLKALFMADPTTTANISNPTGPNNKFRFPLNAATVSGVDTTNYAVAYTDKVEMPRWEPGCLPVNSGGTTIGGPKWMHYKLPGLAIYDAWGVEILYSISQLGGVRLLSAGADGVMRWAPGPNHKLDTTDPLAAVPSVDDLDGSRDNVAQEVLE